MRTHLSWCVLSFSAVSSTLCRLRKESWFITLNWLQQKKNIKNMDDWKDQLFLQGVFLVVRAFYHCAAFRSYALCCIHWSMSLTPAHTNTLPRLLFRTQTKPTIETPWPTPGIGTYPEIWVSHDTCLFSLFNRTSCYHNVQTKICILEFIHTLMVIRYRSLWNLWHCHKRTGLRLHSRENFFPRISYKTFNSDHIKRHQMFVYTTQTFTSRGQDIKRSI